MSTKICTMCMDVQNFKCKDLFFIFTTVIETKRITNKLRCCYVSYCSIILNSNLIMNASSIVFKDCRNFILASHST